MGVGLVRPAVAADYTGKPGWNSLRDAALAAGSYAPSGLAPDRRRIDGHITDWTCTDLPQRLYKPGSSSCEPVTFDADAFLYPSHGRNHRRLPGRSIVRPGPAGAGSRPACARQAPRRPAKIRCGARPATHRT